MIAEDTVLINPVTKQQGHNMRRSAGFTLIELVIVIVILGILGAVAAPKFLNLQGDAYSANVKSLAGSLQTAATLANTQAILEGKDQATDIDGKTPEKTVTGYENVKFINGYPIASKTATGILGALQSVPSEEDYVMAVSTAGAPYKLTLQPKARAASDSAATINNAKTCFVRYTAAKPATSTARATAATVESNAECD
ncbi:MAG: prepilin-type N-terminal cleavage/methylation domain-containing protein [Oceanisphaera sp.]|uniref:pilus assembly FimT family protein n=1 Tax=Oceanisphaera sp. TaxID=1929979 RepID=UPI003C76DCAD